MVIGFAGICLSDWYRTRPSRNNLQSQGLHMYKCGGRRRGTQRKDERLGANLEMVINNKDIKILCRFTLAECFPLFASYKILGFIVKKGEAKRGRKSL